MEASAGPDAGPPADRPFASFRARRRRLSEVASRGGSPTRPRQRIPHLVRFAWKTACSAFSLRPRSKERSTGGGARGEGGPTVPGTANHRLCEGSMPSPQLRRLASQTEEPCALSRGRSGVVPVRAQARGLLPNRRIRSIRRRRLLSPPRSVRRLLLGSQARHRGSRGQGQWRRRTSDRRRL
jgi:hypothetical protein